MCKEQCKYNNFALKESFLNVKSSGKRPIGSVLDNKETFLQFRSDSHHGSPGQKNTFLTSHYRFRNLRLAEKLEGTSLANDETVNKTIRNLRWCSSLAVVEHSSTFGAEVLKSSKSCKNPHCAICARSRASKLTLRLLKAIQDPANHQLFHNKYFYFLTLTVKHDDETRKGIYLEEFNKYRQKLMRSKVMQEFFPTQRSGTIVGTECTITNNGYHIHNHILICAPRLQAHRAKDVESKIRAKWLKITGDSDVIRFDLIKISKTDIALALDGSDQSRSLKPIKEVFKYSCKPGNLEKMTPEKAELYAAWVQATKGKNFVNATGIFRGLQLTGSKSKYDEAAPAITIQPDCEYYIGKVSDLIFSRNPRTEYSTKKRKQIMEGIHLKALGESFHDVTDIAEEMLEYTRVGKLSDASILNYLPFWIATERRAKRERIGYLEDMDAATPDAIDRMKNQLKLFERPPGWEIRNF